MPLEAVKWQYLLADIDYVIELPTLLSGHIRPIKTALKLLKDCGMTRKLKFHFFSIPVEYLEHTTTAWKSKVAHRTNLLSRVSCIR